TGCLNGKVVRSSQQAANLVRGHRLALLIDVETHERWVRRRRRSLRLVVPLFREELPEEPLFVGLVLLINNLHAARMAAPTGRCWFDANNPDAVHGIPFCRARPVASPDLIIPRSPALHPIAGLIDSVRTPARSAAEHASDAGLR